MTTKAISLRWLGVAGLELNVNNRTLVIDPYFTRFPITKLWFGKVQPNHELVEEKIQHCDFILITHAHFDHLMDVPDVVHNTNASVFGSPNACRLLIACGVPNDRVHEISAGDTLSLEEFQVEVTRAEHVKLPGFTPGSLPSTIRPPLRARDYRMDHDLSFLIFADGHRLLTDPGERPELDIQPDVLFLFPLRNYPYYKSLLPLLRPKLVIPTHWDDFFRPLSRPLRPQTRYPALNFPPIQRVNLKKFCQMIEKLSPQTKVLIPEIFHSYDLAEILGNRLPASVT